ncbi:chromate efflux transporter [Duganella radicis]|uniref:Chromate efflux transporter n=1 Tax=Duganella radicis TaxID=551988 RepID=A0A6L6PME7_9BURK|nr:chromate efflux transporter [Duganella radicis]MTV40174.1 chromate efflux transporter [Duganella radicis]
MPPDPVTLPAPPSARAAAAPVSLALLALLFLRIGCTSVGGFMAMVSVTQQVLCERRRLLAPAELLDGLALASVLPGPVAVNVAAYAGYRLRGVAGAAVAIVCAVLPAFLCMVALGTLYLRYGSMGALRPVFHGIAPAIVAIVLAAGWRLWQSAVRDRRQAALGIGAAMVMVALPGLATTLAVMAIAAAVGYHCYGAAATGATPASAPAASLPQAGRWRWPQRLAALLVLPLGTLAALSASPILLQLLGVFSSMSLLAFGGGYVFIPLLQHTVVDAYHWLTPREFVDALAITQLSPGPAMISSALVGLKVAGLAGAAAASIGMFVPSAVLMIAASGAMQRVRASGSVQAALSGMRAALAGMVFAAAATIGRAHPLEPLTVLCCAAALFALLRLRLDAALIVLVAGGGGWLFF